jgi:hypothetical protein
MVSQLHQIFTSFFHGINTDSPSSSSMILHQSTQNLLPWHQQEAISTGRFTFRRKWIRLVSAHVVVAAAIFANTVAQWRFRHRHQWWP